MVPVTALCSSKECNLSRGIINSVTDFFLVRYVAGILTLI